MAGDSKNLVDKIFQSYILDIYHFYSNVDKIFIEKNLVAFCGQYCRDCIYYKNMFGIRAQDLLAEVEKAEWVKMVWESLDAPFDIDNFIAGLTWLAESPGCPGCPAGAGWPECPTRTCAQEKDVRGCFECNEYPCATVSEDEAAL